MLKDGFNLVETASHQRYNSIALKVSLYTNVKWNSACWERKEKSEKPATAFLLFSFLSQQAEFHLTFVFVIRLLISI